MPSPEYGRPPLESEPVLCEGAFDVSGQPERHGEVVRRGQRPEVIIAILPRPGLMRAAVQLESLVVLAECPEVSSEAAGRHQRVRMLIAKQFLLPLQHGLVQYPRLLEVRQ